MKKKLDKSFDNSLFVGSILIMGMILSVAINELEWYFSIPSMIIIVLIANKFFEVFAKLK